MAVGREATISLVSFLAGAVALGLVCVPLTVQAFGMLSPPMPWLLQHLYVLPVAYFVLASMLPRLLLATQECLISLIALFLGTLFFSCLAELVLNTLGVRQFVAYVAVLAFFHFSEYFFTAATNPAALNLDSFLLNHSVAYWLAAAASVLEFFLEWYFVPMLSSLWPVSVLGALLCGCGEALRKGAMLTAGANFNHLVQTARRPGHRLVTHGVYGLVRHPSYVGWFWWAVGTQVLLANPACTLLYAYAAWSFFRHRVAFEESTLVAFFGREYEEYQRRTGTGLPFIRGHPPHVD